MNALDFFARPAWAFRQLLPLTYRSRYRDASGEWFVVWRMWLGRCFAVESVRVVEG